MSEIQRGRSRKVVIPDFAGERGHVHRVADVDNTDPCQLETWVRRYPRIARKLQVILPTRQVQGGSFRICYLRGYNDMVVLCHPFWATCTRSLYIGLVDFLVCYAVRVHLSSTFGPRGIVLHINGRKQPTRGWTERNAQSSELGLVPFLEEDQLYSSDTSLKGKIIRKTEARQRPGRTRGRVHVTI